MEKKKKVVIGMSGGVDSSVAAYLLKEQGYDVIGVTMQIWQEDKDYTEREGGCCSLSAVDDARRVANKIGIPFYVMNFRDSFKEKVIDYFVQEYIEGKTPNPCIACNKHLKFDELLRKAKGIGADYVATGHYAKIEQDENGRYLLIRSDDDRKDQTYALYNDGGDVVHVLADDFVGQVAGTLDGDAVGDGGNAVQGADLAVLDGAEHAGSTCSLDTVDLHVGAQGLDGEGNAGDQTAAADGHDDRVQIVHFVEDLQTDGTLTGNDVFIVKGMDEGIAVFFLQLQSLLVGIVIDTGNQTDVGAEALGGFHLGQGGILR